jgi:hypothetical protein
MGLKWIECIQLLVFYDVVICCLLIETYHVDSCGGVYTPATTLTTTPLSQSVFLSTNASVRKSRTVCRFSTVARPNAVLGASCG